MNIKLLILLAILIIAISPVIAGNNTTTVDNPTMYVSDEPVTEALEGGDSNISFSDGYKGYCIEWGEHSAEKGDKFYIHDKDVDNNIKTFFVYFYDESQRDVIATQHMIWKFTDNKQFSRFNKTLYEKIIDKANTVQVPNDGVMKINNTTEMVYSFRNFISNIDEYQNYFGYKIYFRNITNESNSTSNSTNNNNTENTTHKEDIKLNSTISSRNKNNVAKVKNIHNTGNPLVLLVLSLAIMIFKRKK